MACENVGVQMPMLHGGKTHAECIGIAKGWRGSSMAEALQPFGGPIQFGLQLIIERIHRKLTIGVPVQIIRRQVGARE